ncbi:MAG: nucleotidyl transferase AbiEii/AbiGii toxin family protein [bacterium]
MLEPELVYSSYPVSLRPFRRNLLREYLQFKTLQFLASSADAAKLTWIGGTALRIAYGGDRFSEDLDFDDRGLNAMDFAKMGDLAARWLDTFALLPVAPAEVILAQKLVAILRRPRAMGRDFYDAAFLFGRTRPDMDFLACRLGISDSGELLRLLLERCRTLNLKTLAADLRPFLPDPSLAGRVEAFPEILRSKLT